MPDIFFSSLNEVPEGLREVAVTEGDKVKVSVVPRAKLDEFRENNVKIVKERDDLATKVTKLSTVLGTEDLETAEKDLTALRSMSQRVKDGELVENKGLDEALAERTKEMRSGFESEILNAKKEALAWRDKYSQADTKIRKGAIDRAVTDAVIDPASGVQQRALPDIMERAYKVFQVGDDGTLTPKNGEAVMYGADGVTPMTTKEWVAKLKEEAPYFFVQSNGGGAGGSESKLLAGYTQSELAKMSPEMRLRLANGEKA